MFAVEFSAEALVVIGTLLSAVVGALVFIFKLLMASKDAQHADKELQLSSMKAERDDYRKMAAAAIHDTEQAVIRWREVSQQSPGVPKLAPVVPEHNSPSTEAQRDAARFATLQAARVAAQLQMQEMGAADGVPYVPPPDLPDELPSGAVGIEKVIAVALPPPGADVGPFRAVGVVHRDDEVVPVKIEGVIAIRRDESPPDVGAATKKTS